MRTEADERDIGVLHAAWNVALNSGELPALLELMTGDAVLIGPGQAPMGREEFSANFLATCQQFRFSCTSQLQEVVVVGQVAYARSQDSLTVASRAGGDATQLAGHRMTIYRRQADGRWLLARDAHTLTP
jgi:uncharacterized protein (TIGR02246 family)